MNNDQNNKPDKENIQDWLRLPYPAFIRQMVSVLKTRMLGVTAHAHIINGALAQSELHNDALLIRLTDDLKACSMLGQRTIDAVRREVKAMPEDGDGDPVSYIEALIKKLKPVALVIRLCADGIAQCITTTFPEVVNLQTRAMAEGTQPYTIHNSTSHIQDNIDRLLSFLEVAQEYVRIAKQKTSES
jgi:hypothetical protein